MLTSEAIELIGQAFEAHDRGDHERGDAMVIRVLRGRGLNHLIDAAALDDVTSRAAKDEAAVDWLLERAAAA